MPRRKPLHTLCALFGLSMACQPGTAETAAAVEDVILTADDPVAAFEVTLCLTGGAPNGLNLYSGFRGNASTSEGEVELTLETLDAQNEDYAYVDVINATSEAQDTGISLDAQRDWEGSGERCKQQVVQLSVPSLAEGQTVSVTDVSISLTAEWGGLCGDAPDADSLSIDVVRL